MWLYHENYLITSYFDNSPKSPSFSQRVKFLLCCLWTSQAWSPTALPCASPASLASLLFHEHARHKPTSRPILPVRSSWNVLLPDTVMAHLPTPFIPCLDEPHLTIHLICTPTPRGTSKSSLPISLYRFMYIFPQHLPSMLPLHNILCDWLYLCLLFIVCHYVSLPIRM